MDECDPLLLAGLRCCKGNRGQQGSILEELILPGAAAGRAALPVLGDLGNQHSAELEEIKCCSSGKAVVPQHLP